MSFLKQAHMVEDEVLVARVAACAALKGIANPAGITRSLMGQFSSQPGWAAAYVGSEVEPPGADEAAVTDQMIQAAVDEIYTDEYL